VVLPSQQTRMHAFAGMMNFSFRLKAMDGNHHRGCDRKNLASLSFASRFIRN
jgi:hypothetical protein